MILPKVRDPRLVTVRRGGTLTDDDHRLLALWAADCAEHVLPLFEAAAPGDDRPRRAIELGRAWARGEIRWAEARTAAFGAATGIPKQVFEVAMLYGIRAGELARLRHAGFPVRTLIAYGEYWYPWYMRRLAERPANVVFALRQLLP